MHKISYNKSYMTDAVQDQAWLIFKAGKQSYAIDSSAVKEIVRNNLIFPIPFAPDYLKGIINCYNSPIAVIDFALMQGEEAQTKRMFLVLKDKQGVAFQISDVEEFQNGASTNAQDFANQNEMPFFSGTLSCKDRLVPLIATEHIIDKVRADLENS
mgnify:CR=1 FL=1